MHTETNLLTSSLKPLVPVWVSVPAYLIVSVLLMGVAGTAAYLLNLLLPESFYSAIAVQFTQWLVMATLVTLAAFFFLVFIDRTSISALGLSITGRTKDILVGIAVACAIYIVGFSVTLLSGSVFIAGVKPDAFVLFMSLITFLFASVTEEVMIRGYVQGRLSTRINKFLALGIASLIFAILHIPNPNIGLFALTNIFLAGVMLGAAFMYTQNLWFAIALHAAWNWIQGPVLGYGVSGTNMFPSMLTLELPSNNIINGGAFGFEGSIVATLLMIATIAIIIRWGEKRNYKNN